MCATRRRPPTGGASEVPSLKKTRRKGRLVSDAKDSPTGEQPRYHPSRSAAMAVAKANPQGRRTGTMEARRRRKDCDTDTRGTNGHALAEDAYRGALGWRGETIAARPSPAAERGAPYDGTIKVRFI